MGAPQKIPVLAELAQSRAKGPRVLRQRATKFERGHNPDRKINQREGANRVDPTVLPKQRHQENCQEGNSESKTEDQEKSQNKGLFNPLALFFELRNEEVEAGVQTRDQPGEDRFERLKKS